MYHETRDQKESAHHCSHEVENLCLRFCGLGSFLSVVGGDGPLLDKGEFCGVLCWVDGLDELLNL
jgi:hypothetical protein